VLPRSAYAVFGGRGLIDCRVVVLICTLTYYTNSSDKHKVFDNIENRINFEQ